MNIQGVGNATGHVGNAGGPPGRARGRQHVQEQNNAGKAAKTAPNDAMTAQEGAKAAPGETKVRGVIRLLQQGHFKGVADVRLRINFFDELSAIDPRFTANDIERLDPVRSVEFRKTAGGGSTESVANQITQLDAFLAEA